MPPPAEYFDGAICYICKDVYMYTIPFFRLQSFCIGGRIVFCFGRERCCHRGLPEDSVAAHGQRLAAIARGALMGQIVGLFGEKRCCHRGLPEDSVAAHGQSARSYS